MRRAHREEGATLVEFAIVTSVTFLLLFGMADMALILLGNSAGSNGARDGARVGIINYEFADAPGSHLDHTGATVDNYQAIVDAVSKRLAGTISSPTVAVRCLDNHTAPGTLTTEPCRFGTVVLDQDLIEVKLTWVHRGSSPFVPVTTHSQTARMVISGAPDLSAPATTTSTTTSSTTTTF